MSGQERDEGCQSYNHEKWEASYAGSMSLMRHQNVPNRKGLALTYRESKLRKNLI